MDNLIEEFKHFKSETSSEMMRRNYSRKQREQQAKMLERMDDNLEALSEVWTRFNLTMCPLYSFIHLFIHLFIHSFIHSFIHLFTYVFIHCYNSLHR